MCGECSLVPVHKENDTVKNLLIGLPRKWQVAEVLQQKESLDKISQTQTYPFSDHDTNAPYVTKSPVEVLLLAKFFRCHVWKGSTPRISLNVKAGDVEVTQDHVECLSGHENILGFDVLMDDTTKVTMANRLGKTLR